MSKILRMPLAVVPGTGGLQGVPEIKPDDVERIGRNALEALSAIVDDYIIKDGRPPTIYGGHLSFVGPMRIRLAVKLHGWRGTDGLPFFLHAVEDPELDISPAHPTLNRRDTVYAKLLEEVPSDLQERFYKVDPADPDSMSGTTTAHFELRNMLEIGVAEGEPAANPERPVLPEGAEALYDLFVGAAVTSINEGNRLDRRRNFRTLEEVNELIDYFLSIINDLLDAKHRHPADNIDIAEGSLGRELGETAQDAFDTLAKRTKPIDLEGGPTPGGGIGAGLRPEVLDTAAMNPYDAGSGKLGSGGDTIGGVAVVKIPYPRTVRFPTGEFPIEPNSFVDPALNARIHNFHPDKATESDEKDQTVNLANSVVVSTDGGGAWLEKPYDLPRENVQKFAATHFAAPRDSQFIEIMGGGPNQGDSGWWTLDTIAGTFQQREFNGVYPQVYIAGVWPCGDGVHVLVAEQQGDPHGVGAGQLKWYKVNAQTGASVKINNGPGEDAELLASNYPCGIVGDLIAPDLIVLLVNAPAVENKKLYSYNPTTNTFTLLQQLGPDPLAGLTLNTALQNIAACVYRENQLILVRGQGGIATYIYDYPSRTWTQLNISQPTADVSQLLGNTLYGLCMGNVQGRPMLTSWSSSVWELTPGTIPAWKIVTSALTGGGSFGDQDYGLGDAGFIGMLEAGLPKGPGWILGGDRAQRPSRDVYAFTAGGVIDAACGLTLGGGATSATIELPAYQLPFHATKYLIEIRGTNLDGRVKAAVSFDNGEHWEDVPLNKEYTITHQGVGNQSRKLRLTLIGSGAIKPCVSLTHEVFFKEGGAGAAMTYLVFNAQNGVKYLFMDDAGKITLEPAFAETNRKKAVLLKQTGANPAAPATFDYRNKAYMQSKFEGGPMAGGVQPSFAWDWAVRPQFMCAWKELGDGTIKKLGNPTVVINGNVTTVGLANGESYRIEFGG